MQSDPVMWLANQFYTKLVGTIIPTSWFSVDVPVVDTLRIPKGRPKLEIVSHCWQYAHLLTYQLSSIVNYPPEQVDVTYTLFYSQEDSQTVRLIKHFDAIELPTVTWNWQPIAREKLFRRAIGRHQIAKSTTADWVWFSDCDLIFHRGCLDSVATSLRDKKLLLAFPEREYITDLLPSDHPLITQSLCGDPIVDIDTSMFKSSPITKAKGAFQIVHGEVANKVGYCGNIRLYQQPDSRWRKTFEDTVFRRLLGSEGTPINVTGLHRIRHQAKGRYASGSMLSQVRRKLRQTAENS